MPHDPSATPSLIGRYEVRKELGRGTMGIVYDAYDPALGRQIALKTIELAFAVSPEERKAFEQRFFAEAKIAARLSHPGIVLVHDVGRDPETGTLFIALEYLPGRTLAEIVKGGGPLAWREALRILARLAEALHHAHGKGVIHRDVKPANIMVLPSGEPKILDFGIAKMETARLRLTTDGQFFGTPLYMSPELALGRPIDARSDLFSLGAVAYTLVTGQLAFGAENVPKMIKRVVQDDPSPPSLVVPGIPESVDYVVGRALAKAASGRYPDGQAMAEDIEDVLAGRPPRHRVRSVTTSPAEGTLASPGARTPARPGTGGLLAVDSPVRRVEAANGARDEDSPLAALLEEPPRSDGVPAATPTRVSAAPPLRTRPGVPAPAPNPPPPRPHSPRRSPAILFGALAVFAGIVAMVVATRGGQTRPPPSASMASARASEARPAPSAAAPTPVSPPEEDAPSDHAAPAPQSVETRAGIVASSEEAALALWQLAVPADPAVANPPNPAAAEEKPARLFVDFEHPLRTGTLRIWLGQQRILEAHLEGTVSRNIAGVKFRKGGLEQLFEVPPGRREVRVQVAWDDNERSESLSGTFRSGGTRHLEIRLGRIRKNLSVEWK